METNAQGIYNIVFKDYPDVLNVEELREILGVSPKTVYRLLRKNTIESLKVGREFRIPKVNVMKYFKILGTQMYE